jgi:hypothetical protein
MLIGLQTLMTGEAPQVHVYTWAQIWSHGRQRNKRWLLGLVLKLNNRSLAQVSAEILWLQSLLKELKILIKVPHIFCDNLSVVSLAHNPVLHSRTKHMELDIIFFVREKVINKSLVVTHVPAQDQWADILTN